jgi:ribonuclease D
MDTEFIRTNTFYPIPALYQIATRDGIWLIDPLSIDRWDEFVAMLADRATTKVMHACSEDVEVFVRHFGIAPEGVVDTQVAVAFVTGEFSPGYAALVERFAGLVLQKHETRSDWLNRPLTARQIAYAAEDVRYLLAIWDALSVELERLGRYEWFEEENTRRRAANSVNIDEYYRQVPNAWRLDRRALARLKALCVWRERRARERDMPRRRVLTDDVLYKLASLPELSVKQVERLTDAPAVRRQAPAIVAAAATANALADDALPPTLEAPLDRTEAQVVKQLKEYGRTVANGLGIAEELLVRRRDLEQYVRTFRTDRSAADRLDGWRAPLVGTEFAAILRNAFQTAGSP